MRPLLNKAPRWLPRQFLDARSRTIAALVAASCLLSACAQKTKLAEADQLVFELARERASQTGRDVMQGTVLFESAIVETTPPPMTPEERQKLDLAFNTMREGCDEVMTVRSERAETYRWVAIGMAVAGSIAGGLVPVLTTASAAGNAEWIAGLGTISGAMNGLQSTMGNVGVSYDGESITRQSFLTEWKATLDDYRDRRLKQDYDGAIVAIANASTTCVIYRTALNSRSVVNPLGTVTASPAPSPSPSPAPTPPR